MPAPSSTASETPEQTMARVRSELAASNTDTGITRQLNIERQAGLPSFTATGTQAMTKPSTTPVTPEGQFTTALQNIVKDKIDAKRNELLKPDNNLDTQLALQRGAFYAALVGKADALTAEDLRWLSPSQQAAVRSGDKAVIEGAIVGLNSIMQTRKENAAAATAAKEKADVAAMTRFNTLSENGLLGNLPESEQMNLESQLGLTPGTIKARAQEPNFVYKTSAGTGNSIIETKLDKRTGQVLEVRTIGGTGGTGGTGGGFVVPSVSAPKQTFEDFLKQKEKEAGMTFTQKKRDELRKEFDSQKTETNDVQSLTEQFESVVINLGSVTAQKNARSYFQKLINQGDTKAMENYLNRLALEGLNGKALTDYNAMGTVFAGVQNAQQDIDSFSSTNPGLYKTAVESAKPFLNVSKDQKWVDFTSKVQAAQAGYRNSLFGAALTPQENALANQFLVDFASDNIATIKTKLNNMRALADSVQTRLLNEQRGVFTDRTVTKEASMSSFEEEQIDETNFR